VAAGDLVDRRAVAAAQREVRDERDALGRTVVDDVVVAAFAEAVLVLDRGDGDDLPGALDLLDADRRDADVADLAAVGVLADRPQALLERRVGIHAVQVVEVDRVGAQRAEALLDLSAQRLRTPSPRP
jgi:hypothetical protein